MADAAEFPWVKLVALTGGIVTLTLAARGVSAVVRIAVGEVRYRAGDPDAWLKWLG